MVCIPAQEACVLIAQKTADYAVMLLSVGGFFFIILLFVLWKTPAMEFLMAFMTGKSVVLVTNRSNHARFRTAKANSEGMLQVKKVGPVMVEPNSAMLERISGRPLYICFGEFASTLPLWWVSVINFLKRKHQDDPKPLHNSSDLGGRIGMKFNDNTLQWDHVEVTEENVSIQIKPYYAVRMHELANMFPYNITPALMESKTVHEIAKKQRMWNALSTQMLIWVAMAVLILVIAAYIAYHLFGGSGSGQVPQAAQVTGNVMKVIA
jgi:hypothetical protein